MTAMKVQYYNKKNIYKYYMEEIEEEVIKKINLTIEKIEFMENLYLEALNEYQIIISNLIMV